MATRKQIEANRRNAQKSTGPITPHGKAAASMNALKTGLYAKALVLPSEKVADLETLTSEYHDQFRPDTPELRDLVDEYITLVWQLRRLAVTEVQLYKHEQARIDRYEKVAHPQGQIASNNYRAFESLQRRLDSARRHRDRVRESIRRLRAEQGGGPAARTVHQTAVGNPPAEPAPTPQPRRAILLTRKDFNKSWLRSLTPPSPLPQPPATPAGSPSELTPPPHIPHI